MNFFFGHTHQIIIDHRVDGWSPRRFSRSLLTFLRRLLTIESLVAWRSSQSWWFMSACFTFLAFERRLTGRVSQAALHCLGRVKKRTNTGKRVWLFQIDICGLSVNKRTARSICWHNSLYGNDSHIDMRLGKDNSDRKNWRVFVVGKMLQIWRSFSGGKGDSCIDVEQINEKEKCICRKVRMCHLLTVKKTQWFLFL